MNHVLHTAKLNNNCPECYASNGLEISFVQQETENRFYRKSHSQLTETLFCSNCETRIYPNNWTDEIERVYQYHKKQAVPSKTGIRLKSLSYSLIIIIVLLLILLFVFMERVQL